MNIRTWRTYFSYEVCVMKVIVTKFFEKYLKKNAPALDIQDLVSRIQIESKNFISLKQPFVKIKIKLGNKTYRLLIVFDKQDVIILFVNIFDKKDKVFWENLDWDLHKKYILEWRDKNMECIKKWEYYTVRGKWIIVKK